MRMFHFLRGSRKERIDWLIAGLGNPGPEYTNTRHNAGFQVVDWLAQRHRLPFRELRFQGIMASGKIAGQMVVLLKPLSYLNRSGPVVAQVLRAYSLPPERLLVVYDDLDLPLGSIRLRGQGSAGGHKGMISVIGSLGTQAIPRLRVGIGHNPPGTDSEAYVLEEFTPEEADQVAYDRAIEAIESVLADGINAAMNRFN